MDMSVEIGDLIEPTKESGVILRSGSNAYFDAVVVSMNPFVLVSWHADTLWQAINDGIKPENFRVKRKAPMEIFTKCMNRFKKESHTRKRFEEIDFKPMFDAGFNPLAYSMMMLEDTFYFATKNEAKRAYEYFECGDNKKYVGWWYSIDEVEANNKYYLEKMKFDYIPELFKIKI